MKVLITGASGLIGQAILDRFSEVVAVTRSKNRAQSLLAKLNVEIIEWDPLAGPLPNCEDAEFDAVINLMGEPIAAGRWTTERKRRIRDSRVIGTRNLSQSILKFKKRPAVFVSGSAVGYYGDHGDDWIDEGTPHGAGFLGELVADWESEALAAASETRVVLLRTGIVLSKSGGALAQMLPAYRWGAGAVLGNGRQWMPWIHLTDLVNMIVWAVENHQVAGPLNGVAPNSVTNSEFHRELANVLRRPAFLTAPRFALRLIFGEFALTLLESQRVKPSRALDLGFEFQFPDLAGSLADLLSKRN
ncbi:MAG: TIGR01777 family oxidoreductase [Pirellulaceae bacterium]|nr:TIGR01777 family oxidoreductase [Pirellulaceae bacterium]